MGFIKDLFILSGIKVLSAVLEKLDANNAHAHHSENTPSNWSVYDKSLDRYVVILASVTD